MSGPQTTESTALSSAHARKADVILAGDSRRLLKQTLISILTEGSAALLLLSAVLMARGLGPDGYGAFAYALSLCVVLGQIMDPDFASFLSREFGGLSLDARRSLRLTLGLQILAVAVFGLLLFGLQLVFHPSVSNGTLLGLAGAATVFRVCKKTLRGLLRGKGNFAAEALSMNGERLALAILGAATLMGHLSVEGAMLFFALIRLVDLAACAGYIHFRVERLVPIFDLRALARLARFMLPFAAAAASWAIYNHMDSLMLGALRGREAVGDYAVIYRLFEGLIVIPTALAGAFLPRMAEYHRLHRRRDLRELHTKAIRYLLFLSLPVLVAAFLAPAEILRILYGEAYVRAAGGLTVFLLATPFVFVSWFLRSTFVAIRRTRTIAVLGVASLLLNVALNLYAIPAWGVAGACGATFLTEATTCLVAFFVVRRVGIGCPGRGALARIAASTMAFLMVVLVFRSLFGSALLGLLPGFIAAHLAACRTGFWAPDERAFLRRFKLAW